MTTNDIVTGYCSNAISNRAPVNYNATEAVKCTTDCVTTAYVKDCVSSAVAEATKKPTMPEECRTVLTTKNGTIWVENYKAGVYSSRRALLPEICAIDVYNKTTVVVTFADGTKTSAALHEEDKRADGSVSIEQGISICLTKKLLGENGSSLYNKLINKAIKFKSTQDKALEEETARQKELHAKREKYKRKKAAKKEKAKKAADEEKIELMKEAYLRAFKELKKEFNS